jgi:hypothetical protein
MRARYYNPVIKRFINQDTLLGILDPGISLNRFAYANGNPIDGIDPLGTRVDADYTPVMVGPFFTGAWHIDIDVMPDNPGAFVKNPAFQTPYDPEAKNPAEATISAYPSQGESLATITGHSVLTEMPNQGLEPRLRLQRNNSHAAKAHRHTVYNELN